ncbi:MAG: T9SS C-terminal target domain-containing protein [Ignavibacteriae bacterium]|nr:MAG: T9SS C-terminal target domain-containing protein [Ignavibacteriota bacterium]
MLPFGGSSYDSPAHQTAWQTVNAWIRSSGRFDGVIDLDSALHNPANPTRLLPLYDSGDHLHPSETGHHMIAEAVDLRLLGAAVNTDVKKNSDKIAREFSLLQNHPNPFNPSTAIEYRIQKSGPVEITIYNLLGEKISTLVNKRQSAGRYSEIWDATKFASGIYFTLMRSGGAVQTRPMILLK